ncbi:SpaA isopeptide-forming pilin-related protein [Breznakia pachnodae]|uniref:LPXTG-motif cell wall-anchored protein n=1 Tax=Breznakia pachnodae TaxID=265178 RepID=A0ABU0E4Y5_9FIRM|nr:SpaA isopeptide-forming pilin-related protein [Breznakia pachnodae]MDQ0361774.1 LPXTG-motif cell wall-anchored protein [Breznakia pachnodae]
MKSKGKLGIVLLCTIMISAFVFVQGVAADTIGNFEYENTDSGEYLKNSVVNGNTVNYDYGNTQEVSFDDEQYVNYDDQAYLKKYVSEDSSVQGLFDVTLDIKGNSKYEPVDLVIVMDYSSTMRGQKLENAKEAVNSFLDTVSWATQSENGNDPVLQVGIVKYNKNIETMPLGSNVDDLVNFVGVESKHSGTFIQRGLFAAEDVMEGTNSRVDARKIIIHIGDGSANIVYPESSGATSYTNNGEIVSNGNYSMTNYYKDYDRNSNDIYVRASDNFIRTSFDPIPASLTPQDSTLLAEYTVGKAIDLKDKGYEVYSVASQPSTRGKFVALNIASSSRLYYEIPEDLSGLDAILDKISFNVFNTVFEGQATDPMGEQILLQKTDGVFTSADYELTGYEKVDGTWVEDADLLNGVTVEEVNNTISMSHINLGANQKITLTYKVRINTEANNFEPDLWYRANGQTTLQANTYTASQLLDFPIPSVKAPGTELSVNKVWNDLDNNYQLRPNNILFTVTRDNTTDADVWTKSTPIELSAKNNWASKFNQVIGEDTSETVNLPLYNNVGENFIYSIHEESLSDIYTTAVNNNGNDYTITNTLKTINVGFFKTDEDSNPLKGVEFILTNKDINQTTTETSNEDGEIVFNNLSVGNYVLRESKGLAGYLTFNENIEFEIVSNGDGELEVVGLSEEDYQIINEKIQDSDNTTTDLNKTSETEAIEAGDSTQTMLLFGAMLISAIAVIYLTKKKKEN